MSEHNQIKDRKCLLCGVVVRGKASKLKEHGRECKKSHELAAARAIMQKMQQDMAAPDPLVDMADEKVLNAEGD